MTFGLIGPTMKCLLIIVGSLDVSLVEDAIPISADEAKKGNAILGSVAMSDAPW